MCKNSQPGWPDVYKLGTEEKRMHRWVLGTLLGGLATGCGAPQASPITGDISSVLERGIADGTGGFDHSVWDELLIAYAQNGGRQFDYAGLKQDEDKFDAYLSRLAKADLSSLAADEIQALFINAYNAYIVLGIFERVTGDGTYEIASIREIPDVFKRETHIVGGFELSLDNMEHNILRPIFKDPRVHFAVNCASSSCPPLPVRAFEAARLDEQLEEVTKATLTNPDYISIEDGSLLVTKIMEWYGGDFVNPDFTGSEKTLQAFIAKYATEEVTSFIKEKGANLTVRFRKYDWTLNRP